MPTMAEALQRQINVHDPYFNRGTMLPFGERTFPNNPHSRTEFAVPGAIYDPVMLGAKSMQQALSGQRVNPDDVTRLSLDLGMLGAPVGMATAPVGALAMGGSRWLNGPKLTPRQYGDLQTNSKARRNWPEERKAGLKETASEVNQVRQARSNAQRGMDPLLEYGGGNQRLASALKQRRADAARSDMIKSLTDKYGINPDDLLKTITPYMSEDGIRAAALTEYRKKTLSTKAAQAGGWNKKFSGEVNEALSLGYDMGGAFNRANLEAVPRLLKKQGWKVRHASDGRTGRKSSRYLVSPDGGHEVRISDHYLPDTPQRQYTQSLHGTRWSDEVVLSGNETPQEVIARIMQGYREQVE